MKILLIISMMFISLVASPTKAELDSMKKIVGYFPDWGVYGAHRKYYVDKIPFDKVTHIQVAFAQVNEDLSIDTPDSWADLDNPYGESWSSEYKGNYGQLRKFKKDHPKTSILISIGGWTLSGWFHKASESTANLETFANNAVAFMKKYEFDGIDIDWEFPTKVREPDKIDNFNDQGTPNADAGEKQDFTAMLAMLRSKLDAAGTTDGTYYQLTSAVGSSPELINSTEPDKYIQYLDFLNIMSYDMHGAWDATTNHQSPLYVNSGLTQDSISINNAVELLSGATDGTIDDGPYGVDKSKLVIGSPFYSRGWKGVDCTGVTTILAANGDELKGLNCNANGGAAGRWDGGRAAGVNSYYDIINEMINKDGFVLYRDDQAKVPYLYSESKKEFYTFEDTVSAQARVDYVNAEGLGGIIIWELSADTRADLNEADSLLDVIYNGFKSGNAGTDDTVESGFDDEANTTNKENEDKTVEVKAKDDGSAVGTSGGSAVDNTCDVTNSNHYEKGDIVVIGSQTCTANWWIASCDAADAAWSCESLTIPTVGTTISEANETATQTEADTIATKLQDADATIDPADTTTSTGIGGAEEAGSTVPTIDEDVVNPTAPTATELVEAAEEANKCHANQIYLSGDLCENAGVWYKFGWWTQPTTNDPSALGGVTVVDSSSVDIPTIETIDAGGLPKWSTNTVYATTGTRVIHDNSVYESKWWNKGNEPVAFVGGTPWNYIGVANVATTATDTGTAAKTSEDVKETELSSGADVISSEDGTTATFDEEATETVVSDMTPEIVAPTGDIPTTSTFFMPFIDAVSWPPYDPQVGMDAGIKNFALSFVNSAGGTCSPTWGNFSAYPIDNATLDIPNKIKKITANGGSTMISFGGATAHSDELPQTCGNKTDLANAYQKTIDLTGVKMIDFDIEGGNSYNTIAVTRRMDALAIVQANNPDVEISFTLAVMPYGLLQDSGLMILKTAIAKGIKFKMVNLMLMDFGTAYPASVAGELKMAAYSIQALSAVNGQLKTILTGLVADYPMDSNGEYYNMLGAIPMIGRNDTLVEYFYRGDVESLVKFCNDNGVRMTSMWSLNRDKAIGSDLAGSQLYISTKLPAGSGAGDYGTSTLEFSKLLKAGRE